MQCWLHIRKKIIYLCKRHYHQEENTIGKYLHNWNQLRTTLLLIKQKRYLLYLLYSYQKKRIQNMTLGNSYKNFKIPFFFFKQGSILPCLKNAFWHSRRECQKSENGRILPHMGSYIAVMIIVTLDINIHQTEILPLFMFTNVLRYSFQRGWEGGKHRCSLV